MDESKTWPGNELDGMFAIESGAKKFILPIWLDVDFETVKSYAPVLAGRKAALSKSGISNIARDLQIAVETTTVTKSFSAFESPGNRLTKHAEEILSAARAKKMLDSPERMKLVRENLTELINSVRAAVEELQNTVDHFRLVLAAPEAEGLSFTGPRNLHFGIRFTNTMQGAFLRIHISQGTDAFDRSKFRSITRDKYESVFHSNGTPLWKLERSESRFTYEQLQSYFMDPVVDAIISVTKGDD